MCIAIRNLARFGQYSEIEIGDGTVLHSFKYKNVELNCTGISLYEQEIRKILSKEKEYKVDHESHNLVLNSDIDNIHKDTYLLISVSLYNGKAHFYISKQLTQFKKKEILITGNSIGVYENSRNNMMRTFISRNLLYKEFFYHLALYGGLERVIENIMLDRDSFNIKQEEFKLKKQAFDMIRGNMYFYPRHYIYNIDKKITDNFLEIYHLNPELVREEIKLWKASSKER